MTTAQHASHLSDRHGDNLYPVSFEQSFAGFDMTLDVPEGVWNPTPHGVHLGEMLMTMDFSGEHVLELGTGCGIHAILLAERGASELTMTEMAAEINDNAEHNLKKNKIDIPRQYHVADWTAVPVRSTGPDRTGPWDCVVTNPPFAKSGKTHRRYFIDTLILDAHVLVKPGGRLVFIQSSMADFARSIELMEQCGMTVRVVGETSGPFRDYYFEDDDFMRDMRRVPNGYDLRDGTYYERLAVFDARLPE